MVVGETGIADEDIDVVEVAVFGALDDAELAVVGQQDTLRCAVDAVRAHLASDGKVTDPRKYLLAARIAIADAVAAMFSAID